MKLFFAIAVQVYSFSTYLSFAAYLYIRTGDHGQWTIIFGVIWNLKGTDHAFNVAPHSFVSAQTLMMQGFKICTDIYKHISYYPLPLGIFRDNFTTLDGGLCQTAYDAVYK